MTAEARGGRGDSLVGSLLERRYRVDSLIARGGMSAVYRGLDTRLHRPVAIKVMDSRYSSDQSFIDRFENEARAAASLHDSHVVAVYDQGVDDGSAHGSDTAYIYLVMQLVEGCTLRDVIRSEGALSLPVALSVLEPVLTALDAAHRAGMVHRDIKPENVLIGRDGSVLVTDFGLVRAAASAGTTSGSVILGTVAYLSPEQVTTGAADARTDIYACGIMLYEMLTGSPPYTGDTALSVAYRHVNDDVPAPGEQVEGLPPEIDELVLRATRRDAMFRPDSAAGLRSELNQAREKLGIGSAPIPVPASESQTALMAASGDDGPPTEEMGQVVEPADAPYQPGGPQGTRALARPATGEQDATQDIPAVSDATSADRSGRQRGRRTFTLWAVVVLVLAALVALLFGWLGTMSRVDVPELTGESEASAIQLLQQAGLTHAVSREYDNSTQEGTVMSSTPEAGARVASGGEVELVVSKGLPKVPGINPGTSVDDAKKALREVTLEAQQNAGANQYHPEVPEGAVIGTAPEPGTRVQIGSNVTLVLSKGPQPVPVPDVRGANKADAFQALQNQGFQPYEAERTFDPNVPGDHVITTDPTPNTTVPMQGQPRVGVVLSNAVSVPDVNGKSVQEAQALVSQHGLQLEASSLTGRENPRILHQVTAAGSNVEPGGVVRVIAF